MSKNFLEEGKNPGLGIRDLHKRGFTGKGVKVAIIDQKLRLTHIEYKDRIERYIRLYMWQVGCQGALLPVGLKSKK